MRLGIMAGSGVILLGMVRPGAEILWTDNLQAGNSPWGFSGLETEHPIDETVTPSDANGANLSRAANPLGAGFALRQYGAFDDGGARSQAGIWSFSNAVFNGQAKAAGGVWVAQEWYFPSAIGGGAWLSLWDWHSTDADGGNRWHTSPGMMLRQDGSMRVRFEWGGPANAINTESPYTAAGLRPACRPASPPIPWWRPMSNSTDRGTGVPGNPRPASNMSATCASAMRVSARPAASALRHGGRGRRGRRPPGRGSEPWDAAYSWARRGEAKAGWKSSPWTAASSRP